MPKVLTLEEQSEAARIQAEADKKVLEVEATIERETKSGNKLSKGQKSTLKRLMDRPKKEIIIPEDPQNPEDLVVPVSINGVIFTIPRGKPCMVPDLIYEVWRESFVKTAAANKRIRIKEDRSLSVG